MRDLGKRHGEAQLVANGEDLGRVRFSASFIEDSLGRSGWGVIEGDPGALFKAFTAASNQLRFDDGASAGIVIANPGQGKGTFKTSGPWPGVGDRIEGGRT